MQMAECKQQVQRPVKAIGAVPTTGEILAQPKSCKVRLLDLSNAFAVVPAVCVARAFQKCLL
jgi:hypothetical protein